MNPRNKSRIWALGALVLFLVPGAFALKFEIPKELQEEAEIQREAEAQERDRLLREVYEGESGAAAGAGGSGMAFDTGEAADATADGSADAGLEPTTDRAGSDPAGDFGEEEIPVFQAVAVSGSGEPAATGMIAGQVFNKESGEPLGGVAILLEGTDIGSITDINGNYRINDIPAGQYTVSFIKSGFIEASVTDMAVLDEENSRLDFALPPRPAEMSDEVFELQDYVVTADEVMSQNVALLALRQQSIATIDALSSEDFSKFAASDVAEAVTKISGATVSDGKYLVMRGLNDRYNTTLINGVRLPSPDPDRKAVALDIFPTSLIDSIIARKTYTSDMSGESSGGSVDLRTKSVPDEPFVKFSIGMGGQHTSGHTDTFLADPEQVSLMDWLNGNDYRGYGHEPGSTAIQSSYPNTVGSADFPKMAPVLGGQSRYGDRSYGFSAGASMQVNDWLSLGGVLGAKVGDKKRTKFTELNKVSIKQGDPVLGQSALSGNTTPSAVEFVGLDGHGATKSEQEYSASLLFGLGARIQEHSEINYSFLRTETFSSSAEVVLYTRYEEDIDIDGVANAEPGFYNYLDTELSAEERLLRAHQLEGKHQFDFGMVEDLEFTWFYTDAYMEQAEADQRVIGEFLPDFGTFAGDPGLPPVTRFQRETDQNSTMQGFGLGRQVEFWDGVYWDMRLGYSSEESERDFTQLESRIKNDGFVSNLQLAGVPLANPAASSPGGVQIVYQAAPGRTFEGLDWFSEDFTTVDPLVRKLFDKAFKSVDEKLAAAEKDLNLLTNAVTNAENAFSTSYGDLADGVEANSWNTIFVPLLGVSPFDLSKMDPNTAGFNANYAEEYRSLLSSVTNGILYYNSSQLSSVADNVAQSYEDVADAQQALSESSAPGQVSALQTDKATLTAEQVAYISAANQLLSDIASMPALATDATAFPTFSFFGDDNYILKTPAGFSIYGDSSPTGSALQFSTVDGKFSAVGQEEVESFFISNDLKFSKVPFIDSIRVAGGYRWESTVLSYSLREPLPGEPPPVSGDGAGISPLVVEGSEIDQDDSLNFLSFIFNITENLKFTFSRSATVAKPTFREIAPFPIFNLTDRSVEIGNSGRTLRSANQYDDWVNRTGDFAGKEDSDPDLAEKFVLPPDFSGLEIANVENTDFRVEYFTPLDGLVALGYFKKSIGQPIERVLAYNQNGIDINTYVNNNNDADLQGYEIELQQNLGILGDSFLGVPLSWITLGGNYTLLDAEVMRSEFEMNNLTNQRFNEQLKDPGIFQDGGQYDTRPLYDQPEYVANAFLTLLIEPTGTSLTLSSNWVGKQLDRAGGLSENVNAGGSGDIYWDEFSSLNFVLEQSIGDHWKIKFAVKNLDSPVRTLYEDDIFREALLDDTARVNPGSEAVNDQYLANFREQHTIEPTYSISISGTF